MRSGGGDYGHMSAENRRAGASCRRGGSCRLNSFQILSTRAGRSCEATARASRFPSSMLLMLSPKKRAATSRKPGVRNETKWRTNSARNHWMTNAGFGSVAVAHGSEVVQAGSDARVQDPTSCFTNISRTKPSGSKRPTRSRSLVAPSVVVPKRGHVYRVDVWLSFADTHFHSPQRSSRADSRSCVKSSDRKSETSPRTRR